MKKRIVSLALAVVCLLGAAGCTSDGKEKPNENKTDITKELQKAMEKTNSATSNKGALSMEMEVEAAGEKETIKMEYDFIFNDLDNTDTLEGMMELSMEASGASEKATMYIKDGYVYMDMSGLKAKMASSEFTDLASLQDQTNIESLEKGQIEKATMKKDGDDQVVTIDLKDEEVKKMVIEQLKSSMQSTTFSDEDIKVEDYKMKYVINKDGYIKEQDISFKVTVDYLGETGSISADANIKYDSFDKEEIKFPNFSDYIDASKK